MSIFSNVRERGGREREREGGRGRETAGKKKKRNRNDLVARPRLLFSRSRRQMLKNAPSAAAAAAGAASVAVAGVEPMARVPPLLRVKRMNPNATLPKRGSEKAAGYDVSSAEETTVPARGKACVATGLKLKIPSGTYARIAPRSGLAVKKFIGTGLVAGAL